MFRFTIRDMLWLTVVVAFALGWGISLQRESSHRKQAEWQRNALVQILDRHGFLPQVTPNHVRIYRSGVHWIVLPDGNVQQLGNHMGSNDDPFVQDGF